jgi:hypothetical protein
MVYRQRPRTHHGRGLLADGQRRQVGGDYRLPTLYARIRNEVYRGVIRYGATQMRSGERRRVASPEDLVVGAWAGLVTG